jgi:hypothetical protein
MLLIQSIGYFCAQNMLRLKRYEAVNLIQKPRAADKHIYFSAVHYSIDFFKDPRDERLIFE